MGKGYPPKQCSLKRRPGFSQGEPGPGLKQGTGCLSHASREQTSKGRSHSPGLASATLPVAQTLLLATCFSLSREHRGSQTSARNPGAHVLRFHLHHDPRYSSLLPSETLSGPSTALLPFLPSPGWSPGLGPWQQSTLPKGQMSEGVEKRCPFLLVYSQTLTPCPRLFPLLLPPIDFLVSMEPNSICVHSLPGLASFRDPRAPLVPILLTGQGHHIHHFLFPLQLCPCFLH